MIQSTVLVLYVPTVFMGQWPHSLLTEPQLVGMVCWLNAADLSILFYSLFTKLSALWDAPHIHPLQLNRVKWLHCNIIFLLASCKPILIQWVYILFSSCILTMQNGWQGLLTVWQSCSVCSWFLPCGQFSGLSLVWQVVHIIQALCALGCFLGKVALVWHTHSCRLPCCSNHFMALLHLQGDSQPHSTL